MSRKYWLDLFTGKTWEEFLKSGAGVSGFKERRRAVASRIHPGDYFLCYLTGVSRFIAVLEVLSESYYDDKIKIWEDQIFPVRFKVKILHSLNPKTAVPVLTLKENLSFFNSEKSPHYWTGFFRGSPAEFGSQDAQVIVDAIEKASIHLVEREYDEKKYWRQPRKFQSTIGEVTVPEEKETGASETEPQTEPEPEANTHDEMQMLLLKLGSDLGLDVWVARNDRNKQYKGTQYQTIPNIRKVLPRQFDEATNKTIELIDVVWLQKDAIIAAFEVEHTTSIYSGLLRMSDLISMQPNINIKLYIVAPDERREKVVAEINRPTFARLNPPLTKICKFVAYSVLKKEIDQIGYRVRHMKPQFIDDIAESCELDEA